MRNTHEYTYIIVGKTGNTDTYTWRGPDPRTMKDGVWGTTRHGVVVPENGWSVLIAWEYIACVKWKVELVEGEGAE